MRAQRLLIVGGGIAGLCLAVAARKVGIEVEVLELQPQWPPSGIGILQQGNVVRAMAQLGIADMFVAAGFPFDHVRTYDAHGGLVADVAAPRLAGGQYPALLGMARPALHRVLADAARRAGAQFRFGVSVTALTPEAEGVLATRSDGIVARYDAVVGADGLHSRVRSLVWPEVPGPRYTGQAVWRYNLPRESQFDCLTSMMGPRCNAGVCPVSEAMMYLFVTSNEPGNPHMPEAELATLMRARLRDFGGFVARLRERIVDAAQVLYRPLETVLVPAPWYRGAVALIGDAAHASTPHLAQGGGMAVEDAVVLAEELGAAASVATAFERFMGRRWERAHTVWQSSVQLGQWEVEGRTDIDRPALVRRIGELTARPL